MGGCNNVRFGGVGYGLGVRLDKTTVTTVLLVIYTSVVLTFLVASSFSVADLEYSGESSSARVHALKLWQISASL